MDAMPQGSFSPSAHTKVLAAELRHVFGQGANKATKDPSLGERNLRNDKKMPHMLASGFWL